MRIGVKVRFKPDTPQEIRDCIAQNDEIFGEVDLVRPPGICRVRLLHGAVEGRSYIIGPNQHYVDLLEKHLEEAS